MQPPTVPAQTVRDGFRSVGTLPTGLSLSVLTGPHRSIPRNPLIAEAFHRTGAVEVWGRGTNRIISACHEHGIPAPSFDDHQGILTVTFRATIAAPADGTKSGPSTPQVTPQVLAILTAAQGQACSRSELLAAAGLKDREHFRKTYLEPLLDTGWLAMTEPDKPQSSRQRYRLTSAGAQIIAGWAS